MTTPERARALIVDDDSSFLAIAERLLELRGWTSVQAKNVAEALRAVQAEPVELILLDIGLPDDSGWNGLTRLRELTAAPIVIVTGGGVDAEVRRDATLLGAQAILAKPFGVAEFDATLDELGL